MLVLGFGAFVAQQIVESHQFEWRLLFLIPAFLFIALCLFVIVREDISSALVDHRVVFTLFFCLYFLLGASVATFEQDDPAKFNVTGLPINEQLLLMVDAINLVGFGLALGVSTVFRSRYLVARVAHLADTLNKNLNMPPRTLGGLLICIGSIAKLYLFLNVINQNIEPVSGSYHYFALALPFGIFFYVLFVEQLSLKMASCLVLIAAGSSLIGVILFSKFDAIAPISAFLGAYSLRNKSTLGTVLTIVGCIYLLGELAGAIQYSRHRLIELGTADALTRITIFLDGMIAAHSSAASNVGAAHGDNTTDYFLWGRFSFTEPQIVAIQLYEQGYSSSDWLLWPWTFIPRFLNEAKPVMSLAGQTLFSMMFPRTGSSVSIGIFVDGFYNSGWLGVFVFSILAGWILACTSAVAKVVEYKKCFVLYPLLAVGLYIGFKVDGFWLTDYMAPFIALGYALAGLMGACWLLGFIFSIGKTTP